MNKKLVFVSSNINVLVVNSNGEVTAVGEGTATITAYIRESKLQIKIKVK